MEMLEHKKTIVYLIRYSEKIKNKWYKNIVKLNSTYSFNGI